MNCPSCDAPNDEGVENCFRCGKGLYSVVEGTVLSGRYEILRPLGKGGMGMVYKAHDRALEETVAVKLLRADLARSPDITRRFRSEIKLARKVRHRNVCAIHEYGQEGHLRYIVMEYVHGIDLKALIRSKGAVSLEDAYEISLQIARGLQAIHDVGIVHRDLKTPNIMLDQHGYVRLMDFGIAKEFDADVTGPTGTGNVVGTPEYMSPEQARAEHIDIRSDIYALGVVIYELFTGTVPFKGETPVATMMKHLNEPPPLHSPEAARLPDSMRPILAKALAKDRAARYSSARELFDALRGTAQEWRPQPILLAEGEGRTTPPRPLPEADPIMTPVPTPVPEDATTAIRERPTALGLRPTISDDSLEALPPRPAGSASRAPQPRAATVGWPAAAAAAVFVIAAAGYWGYTSRAPAPLPTPVAEDSPAPAASPSAEPMLPAPVLSASAAALAPTPSPRAQETRTPPPIRQAMITAATPAPPPPAAPAAPPPTVAAADGLLRIVVYPYADVSVDGKPVGTSPPLPPLKLPAGMHTIELSHPTYKPLLKTVTVRSGETTRLEVTLGQEAVPR
jgi:serine/threonine-protein kinase